MPRVAALFVSAVVLAQVDTGTIAGSVTDQSGAVLPDVALTIRGEASGQEYRVATNSAGQFVSPPLQPGPYYVSASRQGFRRANAKVELTLNQRAVLNIALEVGATEQEVTVTAEAPLLESESTTVGNLRTSQSVRDLPLNGRNFANLFGLAAGVVPAQTQVQGLSLTPARGSIANSVNGAGFRANRIMVDGLDNTESHNGQGIILYPSIEAVQEFSMQTSVPPAEFGRGGGNMSIRIKSGTREFRGALFEFFRNSALDAKNFFDAPGKTAPFRNNQFGGVIGGPLLLPGGFNRNREKTFFFFSYEGARTRQAQTFVSNVPLAEMKRGDFSASRNVLFDPATGRTVAQGVQRDPFPGNRIPEARLDSAGRNTLALFPDPFLPGQASNYRSNPSQPRTQNNWDLKIDHRIGANDQMFSRYARHVTNEFTPGALPAPAWGNTSAGLSRYPVQQFVISETHIFSPVLVNEARAGVGRLFIDSRHPNYGDNVAERLGIAGINGGNDPIRSGMPLINITGLTSIGDTGSRPAIITSENWQYIDNLSWYRGKHSLKFGAEVVRRRYNLLQTSSAHGVFSFTGAYTQNLLTPANTGLGAADLLLGTPINGNINTLSGTRGFRRTEYNFYVQDAWKLTPALTMTWGLRYELFPSFPWVEVYDRQANFLPSLGDVFVVGSPQVPRRSATTNDLNNLGPRLGFAYKVGNRMVIRAAYGIFYSGESVPETNLPGVNPPFTGSVAFVNNQADFTGARRLAQGFPLPQTTLYPTEGAQLFSIETEFALPYTQQWNFGIQRQLRSDLLFSSNYVGTKGTSLLLSPNINQPRPGPTAVAARRPYPRFNNIREVASAGSSTYHSLQLTVERRMRAGLSALTSYTWAHSIDNGNFIADRQNLYDLRSERGNSDTDLRHRLVVSYTWELPFGRGRKWLSGMGRAGQTVIGGWQANGIFSVYGGLPFTVTTAINTLNGSGTQRADRLRQGSLPRAERSPQRYFDVAAFAVPAQFTFGNSGVGILNGPGTTQFDQSFFKAVSLGSEGRYSLQFRGELFNLFNTPQFNNPATAIGNPTAGQITTAGSKATFQRTSRQVQFALKLYF
jgi:hypothetical protein